MLQYSIYYSNYFIFNLVLIKYRQWISCLKIERFIILLVLYTRFVYLAVFFFVRIPEQIQKYTYQNLLYLLSDWNIIDIDRIYYKFQNNFNARMKESVIYFCMERIFCVLHLKIHLSTFEVQ